MPIHASTTEDGNFSRLTVMYARSSVSEHTVVVALRVLVKLPAALLVSLHGLRVLLRVNENEIRGLDKPVCLARRVEQREGKVKGVGLREDPHAVICEGIYLAREVNVLRGGFLPGVTLVRSYFSPRPYSCAH